jgi:hypothetical protein
VQIGGSKLLLIDTPGFDDSQRTDAEILTEIAQILSAQYQLGLELKGVIYIHRITDIRYSRSSVKTFEIFKNICGERALKNVLLITSRWNEVSESVREERERDLRDRFWAYMLGRGSHMSRFHGDHDSAVSLVSQLLIKETVVLELQEELVSQSKKLGETAAGLYVNGNMEELKRHCEEELISLERLKRELQEGDRSRKQKIQRDWEKEKVHLQKVREQKNSLRREVAAEVQQQITSKKSTWSCVLPFIPTVISILGMFVGIPPGVTDIFSSWMGASGGGAGS